jgi:hypothetical protein
MKSYLMSNHFESIVGVIGQYEGCNEASYTFKFDGIVWKAIEDSLDGYRGILDKIEYGNESDLITNGKIADVKLERIEDLQNEYEFFSGYILRDITDNHIWLKVGTGKYKNYYPFIIFRHEPKTSFT